MDPPSVSIFNPIEGSRINVGTIVTITGEATDNSRVSTLQLSTDGGESWINILTNLINTTWTYEWDTAGLSLGYRTLKVKVSDGIYNDTFSIDIEMVDTEGPSVSITYPAENSQINIGSTTLISGSAVDNIGIQRLKLSTNGGKTWVDVLSSLSNDRWSYDWETSGCSVGTYTIKIKAWDGKYEGSDYVFIELVDSISPKLTITSPTQNENCNCGEMVTVTGSATDNQVVTELKLSTDNGNTWIDIHSSLNNGNWFYDWDTKGLSAGVYSITITTSDGVNPQVSEMVDCILIDSEMPVLEVTNPIGDYQYEVGDIIIIEGKASDNVQISELWIGTDKGDNWIDILKNLDDRARWTYIWDTSDLEAGTYSVRIKISDGTNEVEKSLTIVLVEEEKEEAEVNIISMLFSPIFLILLVIVVVVVIIVFIFKRRRKEEEVVVVEEIRD